MGLWSRAGHDAMAIASVTDIGMLFVRCYDGISHHPDEDVRAVDVERGPRRLRAGGARGGRAYGGGAGGERDARVRSVAEPARRASTSGSPSASPTCPRRSERAAATLLEHLDDLATYRAAELADWPGCPRRR